MIPTVPIRKRDLRELRLSKLERLTSTPSTATAETNGPCGSPENAYVQNTCLHCQGAPAPVDNPSQPLHASPPGHCEGTRLRPSTLSPFLITQQDLRKNLTRKSGAGAGCQAGKGLSQLLVT